MIKRLSRFVGVIIAIVAIGVVLRFAPSGTSKPVVAQVEYGTVSCQSETADENLPLGTNRIAFGSKLTTEVGEAWVYVPDQYAVSVAVNSQVRLPDETNQQFIHQQGKAWYRLLAGASARSIMLADATLNPTADTLVTQVETATAPDSPVFGIVTVVEGTLSAGPNSTTVSANQIARLLRSGGTIQVVVTSLDSTRQSEAWFQKNKALDSQQPWKTAPSDKSSAVPDWIPDWILERLKSLSNS